MFCTHCKRLLRSRSDRVSVAFLTLVAFVGLAGLAGDRLAAQEPAEPAEPGETKPAAAQGDWKPLFDGQSLSGWKKTKYGGEGEVFVEDHAIVLDFGSSLTGITYAGEFPKSDYEIELEASRQDGIDFFCGLTFPVGESFCSLIVGGWGGAVVGLSSIDGKDASENATTSYRKFEKGKWYRIRLRVSDQAISAWIDDEQVVHQQLSGKRISTRTEVNLSKPLGFSSWETRAGLRKLRYRTMEEAHGPSDEP